MTCILNSVNKSIQHFFENFKRFDCDFLKIDFELFPEFEILLNKLSWIDDDNSHFINLHFLDFDFLAQRSGDATFMLTPLLDGNPQGAAVIRITRPRDSVLTFDFYSSFFSWVEAYEFLHEAQGYPHRVLRCDLALDVAGYTPDQISDKVMTRLSRTRYAEKDGISQTIYIGDLKSKRKLLRIYDKLLDSKKKNKTELYPDLMLHSVVSRVELELRTQACNQWGLSIAFLLDPNEQWRVFVAELSTDWLTLVLPPALTSWYKNPTYDRGVPDPVLRFREALERAQKKGVDFVGEAIQYLRKAN